jgi:hypothetical protein
MKLCGFPYTTTTGLAKYSEMITEIIDLFRTNSVIGTIHPDPAFSPTDEDRLGYWDDCNDDICFGRYLLFKSIRNEEFKFWTGLSTTPWKADLIVWFEKKSLVTQYVEKLRDVFERTGQYSESLKEVWISMKCEPNSCQKDDIKNFLVSVLEVLVK